MNTIPNLTGTIPFRVAGQKALPKFQQELNRRFIEMGGEMPEELRFQCRIATDARENFRHIDLPDGETLTLHPKAKPQFGLNRDGLPYLTATLKYSANGLGYRFRWIGTNVPRRMQEVAVKHDLGKYVAAVTIPLDLADAEVTLAREVNNTPGTTAAQKRAYEARYQAKHGKKRPKEKRAPRTCARITEATISAA